MFNGEELTNMAVRSPTNNLLWRIFHEKTRLRPDMVKEREFVNGDRCLLRQGPKLLNFMASDSFFLVIERGVANLLFSLSFMFKHVLKKLWANGKDIYEYNKMLYYSLRHRENKERIGGA